MTTASGANPGQQQPCNIYQASAGGRRETTGGEGERLREEGESVTSNPNVTLVKPPLKLQTGPRQIDIRQKLRSAVRTETHKLFITLSWEKKMSD